MSDASGPVTTTIDDGVAVVRFDDGKVNVLSHESLDSLSAALDRAAADAGAVCIVGREGTFSAGFDLSVMRAGAEAAGKLVSHGVELLQRIFVHPQPVVAAVTGHALAAGALLVLSCDVRIGTDAAAKIGLNETSIGLPLVGFTLELPRERLDPKALSRATLAAELYDPPRAVAVGYLDRVVAADRCVDEAVAEARRLAGYEPGSYALTKEALRGPFMQRVNAGSTTAGVRYTPQRT